MQRSSYRIEAPHFVAGIESETRNHVEVVVHAAPILKWMIGKQVGAMLAYCVRKGWEINRPARDYPEQ